LPHSIPTGRITAGRSNAEAKLTFPPLQIRCMMGIGMSELEEIRMQRRLLEIEEQILHTLRRIERRLPNPNQVTGGAIRRIGENSMSTTFPTLGPGVSAKFQVTWQPAGVATLSADTSWSSSDETNFPAVIDPTDPTGTTADVTIPVGETATENVTLTVEYDNADGTTASASAVFDLVSGTVAPVDVTGGTIARIA
jgi:hypothetical protein